ncbi:hypothetical protein JK359_14735 [Streptomyces actinomycinicus]|uniref:Uncharacterized protein n=1 Tax=Streptomyces actinomycinicus TaxID=1695166 RepID=A0A937JL48_9ACTN|nr:hypothetical protein [Streptomyces actinomycinicus]MBL1083229.1 hypothetical protein [Streptomyces actinomycinicus]
MSRIVRVLAVAGIAGLAAVGVHTAAQAGDATTQATTQAAGAPSRTVAGVIGWDSVHTAPAGGSGVIGWD